MWIIEENSTIYIITFLGYSFVTNPWQVLIFEALEAVTVSLAITAASTYAVALSNLQTIASIQGLKKENPNL